MSAVPPEPSAGELLDRLSALGVVVDIATNDTQLFLRGPTAHLDAARPTILRRRPHLLEELRRRRSAAIEHLLSNLKSP
jgi:hypothetical protein